MRHKTRIHRPHPDTCIVDEHLDTSPPLENPINAHFYRVLVANIEFATDRSGAESLRYLQTAIPITSGNRHPRSGLTECLRHR
jgi:hypothetical protein